MSQTNIKKEGPRVINIENGFSEPEQQSLKALKESEERYHSMINEVEDYAILLMDKDGNILNWNKGAQKIKGYTEQEILGKNFRIFYLPEDRERKLPETLIQRAIDTGKATHEGWRVRKDSTRFWGSICITALHNSKNDIIGFSKVTRDLTERKEAEEKLKRFSQELELRNKELEQFAFVASHDLQEPLRKIATFSEMLRKNLGDKDLTEKYIEKIIGATKRMSTLITDILNFSKLSGNQVEEKPVDLSMILNNVMEDLELAIKQKEVNIVVGKLPVIKAIEFQMHQLFYNFLSNSIKFSKDKPEISITSESVNKNDFPEFEFQTGKEYVLIRFTDNGIGIDPKFLNEIFKLFTRLNDRSYAGSGIGLALCKKIVENHYGFIKVNSEVGKGAEFQVVLPK